MNLVHSEIRTQPHSSHALQTMLPIGNGEPEDEMTPPHLWELKSLPSHPFPLMSTRLNTRDLAE